VTDGLAQPDGGNAIRFFAIRLKIRFGFERLGLD